MEFGLFRKFGNLSKEEEQKIKEGLEKTEIGNDESMSYKDREGMIQTNPAAKTVERKMQMDLGIKEATADFKVGEALDRYEGDPTDKKLEEKYHEAQAEREEIENRKNPQDPMSVFGRN